jgi:hypothetical protein
MKAGVSRALMSLATYSLGESRREWAFAMQAEYEAADEAGAPLAFAAGCLIAAWCEMPNREEGRLALANHALALGLLIPVACLQFACAIGLFTGHGGLLAFGGSPDPYLAGPQLGAIPALIILWLVLGVGHLRLAWVLVERDWPSVVKVGALMAAATVTLFGFMGVLFLDATPLLRQAAVLAIEFMAVLAAARWHARLFPNAAPEQPAW